MRGFAECHEVYPGFLVLQGVGADSTGLGRRPRLPALRRTPKSGGGGSGLRSALREGGEREGPRCAHCGQRRTGGGSSSSAIRGARRAAESGNARSADLWLDRRARRWSDGRQERRAASCAAVAQGVKNNNKKKSSRLGRPAVAVAAPFPPPTRGRASSSELADGDAAPARCRGGDLRYARSIRKPSLPFFRAVRSALDHAPP